MSSNAIRLAAAIAVAGATLTSPADAASLCLENIQLAFSPPLTATTRIGTVTVNHKTTCADVPGFAPSHYEGTYSAPYFGSCALAVIDDFNDEAVLVGGTAYVFVRASGVASMQAVTSESACPISSAHGSGVVAAAP